MSKTPKSEPAVTLPSDVPEDGIPKAIASAKDLQNEGGACAYAEKLATSYHAIESRYRKRLWKTLARAYQLALIISNSPEEWRKFCDDEFWEGHNPPNLTQRKDANKWVMIRIMGHGPDQYKQISKYAIMLRRLRIEGVDPADAEKEISERGVAKIVADAAKHRPDGIDGAAEDSDNRITSDDAIEADDEAARAQAKQAASRSSSIQTSEPTITVRVTEDALWQELERLSGRIRLIGEWEGHDGNYTLHLKAAKLATRKSHNAKNRSERS